MHFLLLGGSREDREHALRIRVPATHTVLTIDTGTLPFVRPEDIELPPTPRVLLLEGIDRAFPDAQVAGTRLVLTQSIYLVQAWIDALDESDRIIATADRATIQREAPEALQARGPWSAFEIVDLDRDSGPGAGDSEIALEPSALGSRLSAISPQTQAPGPVAATLATAYASGDPAERLRLCREAVSLDAESAVAEIALASVCREVQDSAAARDALDRAAALAPDWEAVPYEYGKVWLAHDDMERARDAFQRAAGLMPTFSAAFSNLGATLGELGDTGGALAAFEQALAHDSRSFAILNNVGVVNRELGRLDESEAALRRVIDLAPEFVFGHYNLGHTLFLAGKYRDALAAYEEGQRRDPEQNRRQGCRLAVIRLANDDLAGAERDFWRFANAAPSDERDDLLLEAYEITHALLAQHPALAVHQAFLDRVGAEIAKSE